MRYRVVYDIYYVPWVQQHIVTKSGRILASTPLFSWHFIGPNTVHTTTIYLVQYNIYNIYKPGVITRIKYSAQEHYYYCTKKRNYGWDLRENDKFEAIFGSYIRRRPFPNTKTRKFCPRRVFLFDTITYIYIYMYILYVQVSCTAPGTWWHWAMQQTQQVVDNLSFWYS